MPSSTDTSLPCSTQAKVWIEATRPKTLPAAIAPVIVATSLAAATSEARLIPAGICLVFALLIQIGTNFANDYFDGIKGTDTKERLGPTRAVAAGLITPHQMRLATILTLAIAFLLGLTLISYGGIWLLIIGIASVLFAIGYTGGPYPLAYHGLGDIFVLLFFGLIATGATYYVQTLSYSAPVFLTSVALGLLANNLLVINNTRDLPQDRQANKRTLAVRYGEHFCRLQHALSHLIALLIPIALATYATLPWTVCLPTLLLFPNAYRLCLNFSRFRGKQYNRLLAQSGKHLILYSALLALGILL